MLKHAALWFRPSRLLGLLLFGELGLFFLFVLWESCLATKWLVFGQKAPALEVTNWLFLIGVVSAITGWIVSSYITLRNSIKQHTINTLLQSRLSAMYMENARHINKSFFAPGMSDAPIALAALQDPEKYADLQSIDYVLNYLEFLSVGIRHGDLDEKVLRHTMRGIVLRLYEKVIIYMRHMRCDDGVTVGQPQQLEHLTWLYTKWKKTKIKEEKKTRMSKSNLPS